ncbi:MAG: 16S rRNA (cytidine(1402)-2'-O)-methyltransferase [Rikenellaceae bacterium]
MSKLFIVPTPIGNLDDITLRALNVLKEVELILAEDTRTSAVLLNHYDIKKPLTPFHKFNEHSVVEQIASKISAGIDVALISDAGTPGISDPGFLLVRSLVERGVEVETLPGATAFIPALINSGFPCDKFCFEGFLPHKKGKTKILQELAKEQRTIILYESPHRILKTLVMIQEIFTHNPQISVSRELTKKFEETIRGDATTLITHFTENEPRGEFVVVIEGLKEEKKEQRSKYKPEE